MSLTSRQRNRYVKRTARVLIEFVSNSREVSNRNSKRCRSALLFPQVGTRYRVTHNLLVSNRRTNEQMGLMTTKEKTLLVAVNATVNFRSEWWASGGAIGFLNSGLRGTSRRGWRKLVVNGNTLQFRGISAVDTGISRKTRRGEEIKSKRRENGGRV